AGVQTPNGWVPVSRLDNITVQVDATERTLVFEHGFFGEHTAGAYELQLVRTSTALAPASVSAPTSIAPWHWLAAILPVAAAAYGLGRAWKYERVAFGGRRLGAHTIFGLVILLAAYLLVLLFFATRSPLATDLPRAPFSATAALTYAEFGLVFALLLV